MTSSTPPASSASSLNVATPAQHPALALLKARFPDQHLKATVFRGQTAVIAPPGAAHEVLRFLRDDPRCDYDFLSDVTAVDYLNYPAPQPGRFAVVYVLQSTTLNTHLIVKVYLNPTGPTDGIAPDAGLQIDSVTDLWPGAEWTEREVYDMFGIHFRNHPDLRRILLWESYPAFPLRKDYPLRGRGERELYKVVERDDA